MTMKKKNIKRTKKTNKHPSPLVDEQTVRWKTPERRLKKGL